MLKYLLIIILNLPFVLIGIARTVTSYQNGRISRVRAIAWMVFWLLIIAALIGAEPGYRFLQDRGLTDSTPLSIFDVGSITGIILSLTLIFRLYTKIDILEQRVAELNTQSAIRLSKLEDKS